ncbi:sulfotransferase [Streptomyces carminius]|uniref:Sulfotransferase n=1 Tax=Streptomyces carminius TaxID=2665496 RepID=A0A2M8MBM3_9ACTN|nr:sulfotransferase [Streptomyces carminius]PJF01607.1 sulfotransferase [Streptomyces carminius]
MTAPGAEHPVLIVGTERSGSNLLRLILESHSRITVPHPPHFMRYLAPLAGSYGDLTQERNRARAVGDALGLLRRHIHPWPHPIRADRIIAEPAGPGLFGIVAAIYEQHRAATGKARWGCKSTFMVAHVADVLRVFPDARFVWLVRDPCDVASSAKRAVFGPSHPYRMARLWRAQQEKARAALDSWGPGVVHLLRYEDLVSRPEEEIGRLCDFLGEKPEPAMLRHHTSAAARQTAALADAWRRAGQPVSTDRIGAGRQGLSTRERLWVDKVTGPVKQSLGYPVDARAGTVRDPRPSAVALRSVSLRARIEYRSMRKDGNHRARLRRDVYVRWLRFRAWKRGGLRPPVRGPAPAARRGSL